MKHYHNISIAPFSYIKVGGIVKDLYIIENEEEILTLYKRDFRIVGNGSKILFAFTNDESTYIIDRNSYIKEYANFIEVGGGTPLSTIGQYFENKGYLGFSRIRFIPGRLGGALVQNASCFNECISDLLVSLRYFDGEKIIELRQNECQFSYRDSIFKGIKGMILSSKFKKVPCNPLLLKKDSEFIRKQKEKSQPLHVLSLGSTFQNVQNYSVSKILDELNFKGFGLFPHAHISLVHSNFIEIKKSCFYPEISLLINHLNIVLYKEIGIFFPIEIVIFRRKDGRIQDFSPQKK